MFSMVKRTSWVAAAGLGLMVLIAGCMGNRPESGPKAVSAGPALVHTNEPLPVIPYPPPPADAADNMASNLLAWDAVFKQINARAGQTNVFFTFTLTNVSPDQIVIYATDTTCDCAVAKLPASPWVVPPEGSGQIKATVDLAKKWGNVTNYVIVFTSKGNRMLTLKTAVPRP
jgi:Protein of unknown function (DUF1573)